MSCSSGKPQARGDQVSPESLKQKECVAISVVAPFAEPGSSLTKRNPQLRGRLIVAGRLAARGDKERAAGREPGSKTLAMRPCQVKKRRASEGVVAITRYLCRQILRFKIPDVGAQIRMRIGP